ncbi:hypothetical protein F8O01_08980 [Pseudoclavibacter chungangensis]|uniref:Uncharacterized protein n=1 Tax=Pseudoclavibacter chungangensis TaxID=587635 RepID=A0A7J5BR96_9MICO|nr:hypothetical protein [Pseudoclavibacter chungangensis]KAB1656785.1 hypothetical protein F8O01_08980 [Pseudoclavibacter chungangensis]NYJ67231.1 hypothetical protein [Pseudoclavibacter chungangensis]
MLDGPREPDRSPGDDPHPHTGASFVRPPSADADDYFHRLVVASHGGDAPTGMIVMPETFDPDLTGALNRTGDVMLTGSLRVSRELSSYGGFRDDLESPDVDVELITDNVRGQHRPVPARRSVSAQRETGLGLTPTHERGIKVWIGVLVGALVVAVGGAGVIVFGFVNGWF